MDATPNSNYTTAHLKRKHKKARHCDDGLKTTKEEEAKTKNLPQSIKLRNNALRLTRSHITRWLVFAQSHRVFD